MDAAERFLDNAEASFNELAAHPLIGAALTLQHPDLASMRKWRVKGFDKHRIYYQPRPESVSIVRVLYAARDWWELLGITE